MGDCHLLQAGTFVPSRLNYRYFLFPICFSADSLGLISHAIDAHTAVLTPTQDNRAAQLSFLIPFSPLWWLSSHLSHLGRMLVVTLGLPLLSLYKKWICPMNFFSVISLVVLSPQPISWTGPLQISWWVSTSSQHLPFWPYLLASLWGQRECGELLGRECWCGLVLSWHICWWGCSKAVSVH